MRAEIIASGTELLLGEIVDTNSAYIARCLRGIGVDLYYLHAVGDNERRMADLITQGLERSDLIITTGGLGPTVDDVTRAAVARAAGRELVLMPELLADIERFFGRTGRRMTDNNRRQAYIPAGSIPIRNPVGTAPCFIVEDRRGIIISLPGVPREMEHLMQTEVLPYLSRLLGTQQTIKARILRTVAIGESTVDSLIGDLEEMSNPTVGLSAHPGQTDIRITAKGQSEEEADRLIAAVEEQIRGRLGDVIFGVDRETLEGVVVQLLKERGCTLALVESNTQGIISSRLKRALEDAGESGRLLLAHLIPSGEAAPDRGKVRSDALTVAQASGADILIYIAGTAAENQGVHAPDTGQTLMALVAAGRAELLPFRYGGKDPLTQQWIAHRALDLLRRELLGLRLDPG